MQTPRTLPDHRKARGLTLDHLAYILDLSPSSVSKIERGLQQPSPTVAARLAVLYGVELQTVLDLTSPAA